MARFERRALSSETVPFALRIDKFSLVVRRGYYEGPAFEDGRTGSRWRLVVYASEGAEYEDLADIRLRREESAAADQCVEVRVAVDDYFGLGDLSEKGQFCFSRDMEAHRVMSVPGRFMSGFNRLRYLPDDTLTIRGEMIVYQERKMLFDRVEDFDRSQDLFAPTLHAVAWWTLRWALPAVSTFLYAVAVVLQYAVYNLLVPSLKSVVLPFMSYLLLMSYHWIKKEAFKILKIKKAKERPYPRNSGREVASFADAGRGEIVNYCSGGKNYDRPWKQGQQQTVVYVVDSKHFNELKNHYYYE